MLIQLPADNPQRSVFLTQLLQTLRPDPFAGDYIPLLRADGFVGTNNVNARATTDCPAWAMVSNADLTFVMIDGSTMASQALNFVAGYRGIPADQYLPGWNRYVVNAVSGIRSRAGLLGPVVTRRMSIVGWSLGGSIALGLAAFMRLRQPTFPIDVTTFGSPRPCSIDGTPLLSGVEKIRWMNDNDPIPLIPPRFSELTANQRAWESSDLQVWARMVQPGGGISLSPGGAMVSAVTPGIAQVGYTTSLANWMYSVQTQSGNAHTLQEYAARLNLAIQIAARNVPRVPRPGHDEGAGGWDADNVNRAERRSVNLLREAQAAQDAPPVTIPTQFAFVAFRSGRLWLVAYNGQIVATTPNKRTARGLAREGNFFLRRLQRMALVDANSLSVQFQQYLANASDPTSGFVPTLRVPT